jgi:hypothetical protein
LHTDLVVSSKPFRVSEVNFSFPNSYPIFLLCFR